VSAAPRAQEGALTLQLFQLFCDVLVKAPAMEAVLAPVFARLIQARPLRRRRRAPAPVGLTAKACRSTAGVCVCIFMAAGRRVPSRRAPRMRCAARARGRADAAGA